MGIFSKRLSVFLGLAWVVASALVSCSGQEPAKAISPTSYKFLRDWGNDLTSDGRLHDPNGVAVDAAGNVYVADGRNHRIQKFGPEGIFLTEWGSEGRGDGQFAFGGFFGYRIFDPGQAGGIAVDQAGNVYVADDINGRIQKFSAEGAFLAQWGIQGKGNGQFSTDSFPFGVAVDAAGNVYVAYTLARRMPLLLARC